MVLNKELFVGNYAADITEGSAAVFVGAGLSKAAGYVDWPTLLAPLAKEIGLDIRKENDIVGTTQFYLNAKSANRYQLTRALIDRFSDLPGPTESHKILARLPIRTFWTTNYDTLLESTLEAGGKRVDVKHSVDQLTFTKPHRDAVIYKMHGDISHPHLAILTRDDYEAYYRTHEPFITELSASLASSTFCFVGFSFSDPNLAKVLAHVRLSNRDGQRTHYCVTRRHQRHSFDSGEDFAYACAKQDHQALDLMRFNIDTVYIDEFSQIASLLSDIERCHRVKTVFISGSAAEYGGWSADRSHAFLAGLAGRLIQDNFRINTGFAVGVGGPVVSGAVQEIYSRRDRTVGGSLTMRPFPVSISVPEERERAFARYRDDLISQAGIAVFVFGNNTDGGSVALSRGVREEFRLARARGLKLLPIGATGYQASVLWNEIAKDFDACFPLATPEFRAAFQTLGASTSDPTTLVGPAIDAIRYLARA